MIAYAHAEDAANDLSDSWLNRRPEDIGAFERDGKIYRVVRSRGGSNLYAKVLNPETNKFEYAAGAIYNIRESDRLSQERAIEVSAQIGACAVCGRTLTVTTSIERGIGPVCWGRLAS